jgi:hypothetical protein
MARENATGLVNDGFFAADALLAYVRRFCSSGGEVVLNRYDYGLTADWWR